MYQGGAGGPQVYKEAVKWYRLAAEQGLADAQLKLELMYFTGEGVIKNKVYAHMWFNIAGSKGAENGTKIRDLIARTLTPEQIAKAQELAQECVKKGYKSCE